MDSKKVVHFSPKGLTDVHLGMIAGPTSSGVILWTRFSCAPNEEGVLCSDFVHRASFSVWPSSCRWKQAIGSVLLVDVGGRGDGS
jgi:hypothetical protein